jgi:polyisoprenoid-binding protein YceI
MFKRILLASLIATASSAAFAAAEPYAIDASHTNVVFTWNHLGFSNLSGRFEQVQGDFRFDAEDPTQSTLRVTIPVSSLSTGVPRLDEHLRGDDFFDVANHPEATFVSKAISSDGEGRYAVMGELTIRGVTRPAALAVTVNKIGPHPMSKKPAAGFDATMTIRRSEFGMTYALPAVPDEIRISISTETSLISPAE